MLQFRIATDADVPALAAIYRSAVESLGPEHYSERQVAAWAMFPAEARAFQTFILGCTTFVAMESEQAVGFGGISDDGHVRSLYVHADRFRDGIGSALLLRIIENANQSSLKQLRSEASSFSRPLFLKHGFDDAGTEVVVRHGVEFVRFLVTRAL